ARRDDGVGLLLGADLPARRGVHLGLGAQLRFAPDGRPPCARAGGARPGADRTRGARPRRLPPRDRFRCRDALRRRAGARAAPLAARDRARVDGRSGKTDRHALSGLSPAVTAGARATDGQDVAPRGAEGCPQARRAGARSPLLRATSPALLRRSEDLREAALEVPPAQVFEGRRVDRRPGRRAGHLARPAERVEQHAAARQTRSEGARPHACATRARPPAHTACRLTLRVRPAVQAAMTPDPRAIHPQSRMHGGGRLSFRRRVREVEDDGTLPCILGGEDPPPLRDLVRGNPTAIEIEVGPGKGTFLLAAAQNRPDTFLVGIEASVAYAKFAAQRVRDAGLRNAVLLVD